MRVMALDASSTTIGLAILDHKKRKIKLVHQEFWKPPKDGSLFERLSIIKKFVRDHLWKWKPDELVIEDIVQHMAGRSGAKTIILLAVLNRTIGLTYYETTNREPRLLNVMTVRHALKFNKKLPAKQDMPDLVAKHLKIKFPYYKKINKKGIEKICEESYDVADAISVGLAFIKIQSSNKK